MEATKEINKLLSGYAYNSGHDFAQVFDNWLDWMIGWFDTDLLGKLRANDKQIAAKARSIADAAITRAMKSAGYQLTEARLRKIINHIRTTGMIRWLIATSKGYYIATSVDEMRQYIESLRGREDAIRAVRESMEKQLN